MPFTIEPIACSRMPKCIVRPYGSPGNIFDCRSVGRKLGTPSMVVLFDSARSAEPPHSSGSSSASALSTLPEAARVEMSLGSASQVGIVSSQPGVSSSFTIRSYSALASGLAPAQSSNAFCHSASAAPPRSASLRVWAMTSSATSKVWAGSKPSSSLVAATSSSPSADPCALPVFRLVGAGQPMIVRRLMKLGRSVTSRAAFIASFSSPTSSLYSVPSLVQSISTTCQPYAS